MMREQTQDKQKPENGQKQSWERSAFESKHSKPKFICHNFQRAVFLTSLLKTRAEGW